MQALDAVANGRDHALDLVVLAFGQREVQHMLAHLLAGSGLDGLGVIVEHHAVKQALHLAGIDRMLGGHARSEEHTSELQSQSNLVCRLLLEKKKQTTYSVA